MYAVFTVLTVFLMTRHILCIKNMFPNFALPCHIAQHLVLKLFPISNQRLIIASCAT